MSAVSVIEIIRKEGYLLEDYEIQRVTEIYASNNKAYTPTLIERHNVEQESELYDVLHELIIERVNKGYIFYLIYLDGELVGFNNHLLVQKWIKGTRYAVLQIGTTSISPDYQNKGIGTALYARIDEDAEHFYKVEAIIRVTWSTNERQKHLYEKYAYKPYLIRLDHFGIVGVDSITYYKLLQTSAQTKAKEI